jgi:type IV pilus assembly protein PilC
MTAFKYVAVDADGKKVRATADAVNQDSLRNELEARQLRVTKIARRRSFTEIEITKRKVPREDVMHFSRQVAAFVRAGIPLVEALDTVRETASNARLREILT